MSDDMILSRLDSAFARFLSRRSRLDGTSKDRFEKLVAHLSFVQNQGHSCIRLTYDDVQTVLASGLASLAPPAPLIIEDDRLYFHRYWAYEQLLARKIVAMTNIENRMTASKDLIDRYFPSITETPDWQREAAETALKSTFCIITGGPGTGKTTTVVKILALLQESAEQPLAIALAAPTGKAAMRLQESIGNNKHNLPCSDAVKHLIPETVTTLHRLLGPHPPSPYFKHHAENPLPFDLVVVDEASMVDLALMSKLTDALKPCARLILLGDKDQLASVESGAVLADLTLALPNHTVELKKAHRFHLAIKQFADAINLQNADDAWSSLENGNGHIGLLEKNPIDHIIEQRRDYLHALKKTDAIEYAFAAFNRFQALCANRAGPNSVADINYRVERRLASVGAIQPVGTWYHGRPIMIMQNDASLKLYNGDVGLCLESSEHNGKLMVFFQRPDGSIKSYLPARLPQCQTVYAMTIHKSQGSEFDEVLIVLPNQYNPILTKELLYTAVTRAKKSVRLLAERPIFNQTVQRKIERFGGLAQKVAQASD